MFMKFLPALILSASLAACGARSSDQQQVRDVIDPVEAAAEKRDTRDIMDFVAADYSDSDGLDHAQLESYLRAYLMAHPKVELFTSIDKLEFPANGLAQAEVTVTGVAIGDLDRVRLKVEFRRNAGGDWLVSRADRQR
jgi:hypothetical protein